MIIRKFTMKHGARRIISKHHSRAVMNIYGRKHGFICTVEKSAALERLRRSTLKKEVAVALSRM